MQDEPPSWGIGTCLSKRRRRLLAKHIRTYLLSRTAVWWLKALFGLLIVLTSGYVVASHISAIMVNAPADFSAYLAKIKHTPALQTMRLFLGGYSSYIKAKNYFESQEAHLNESIALHPFWARSQQGLTGRETWQDMVIGRMSNMVKQLKEMDRDDFKIEKDKCEMYGFFKRNDIPFVPLAGMWSQKAELLDFLRGLRVGGAAAKYTFPLWLKSCHLTQGDDAGRRMITHKDLEDDERFNEIVNWVERKYTQKPNDNARAWSDDAKVILDTLKPRFLIQESYKGPYGDSVGFQKAAPVELKVEVVWGRAYLANICDYEAYALRDGTIERWDTSLFSRIAHVPVTSEEQNQNVLWLHNENHMEKVFKLAEKVCKAMMADQVRVDIFVRPGDPDAIVVNEISISPGALYKWHAQFMASAWRNGHVSHLYQMPATTNKVYEEGPREGVLSDGSQWFVQTNTNTNEGG